MGAQPHLDTCVDHSHSWEAACIVERLWEEDAGLIAGQMAAADEEAEATFSDMIGDLYAKVNKTEATLTLILARLDKFEERLG